MIEKNKTNNNYFKMITAIDYFYCLFRQATNIISNKSLMKKTRYSILKRHFYTQQLINKYNKSAL